MSDISDDKSDVIANFGMERTAHGTSLNPHVRPPAPLPRDIPRARCRMVQWLAACLPDLRNRVHCTLYLSGEFAELASLGAADRPGRLHRRQLLRVVDPSFRDAPPLPDQGVPRDL